MTPIVFSPVIEHQPLANHRGATLLEDPFDSPIRTYLFDRPLGETRLLGELLGVDKLNRAGVDVTGSAIDDPGGVEQVGDLLRVCLEGFRPAGCFDQQISMDTDYDGHWIGTIEPHEEGTQIWYKIVVDSDAGTFESATESYVVGEGSVTVTTTPTTNTETTETSGTTSNTGTGGGGFTDFGEGLSIEVLMMIGGIGVVVVILGGMAKRRK